MTLKDTDKLIELIDDDIASLDKNTSRLIDTDQLIGFIDAYITILNERYKERVSQTAFDVCLCTLQMVKQYIKALPTVEPTASTCLGCNCPKMEKLEAEPIKHGRWKHHQYCNTAGYYECDNCGKINSYESNYCPKCGARMDGGENG